MRTSQRLRHQRDPRVRRSLALALASAGLLILSGLLVVGLRVQQIHLGYRLDELKGERARLETLSRQLEVEVATLRSPSRVESRARQLGLVAPDRQQVRQAREYVGSGAGLATAGRGRIVAATLPGSDTGVPGPREP